MRTLAIDTSLAAGSISACGTDRSIERTLPIPGAHARLVAAALRDAAGELGWDIGTAELVAVVRGPGSFTGLRVGVALAKGIAWACGARLVGVSGFETIAWKSDRAIELLGRPLEIAYDAGRGDVYAAPATPCGTAASGWTVGPPRIVRAESWIATLPAAAVVAGPALAVLAERLARPAGQPVPRRRPRSPARSRPQAAPTTRPCSCPTTCGRAMPKTAAETPFSAVVDRRPSRR
jgi:tRNA threonylcarbamoyl adenosine modification protein YeaZ